MLGQVVVDAQHRPAGVAFRGRLAVLAGVHEILAHGAARVGRQVLDRRRRGGRGDDHDRVVHRPVGLERLDHLGDGGLFLADRDVDADHVGVFLIDDRVDGDGGLAGLAIADDQLALAAADRSHAVDGLEPGLERFVDHLPFHHARSDLLHVHRNRRLDRALAVQGLTKRIDHPAQHGLAGRHLHEATGAADLITLLDQCRLAE